ncbi:DUF5837 family cyanobactin class RiPP [Nostoc sp.]|uniref:DUF5837 family cyanobactin class RiPP n=1 Tax=Nostoc sp. TaxID=1180 RepID=UPI002FEEE7E5
MDKKNLMPQAVQPINRITTGQMPIDLAELSEEALHLHGDDSAFSSASVLPSYDQQAYFCSYDGDYEE